MNPIRMLSHDGRSRIARTHFYSNREDAWAQIDNHYREPALLDQRHYFHGELGTQAGGILQKAVLRELWMKDRVGGAIYQSRGTRLRLYLRTERRGIPTDA